MVELPVPCKNRITCSVSSSALALSSVSFRLAIGCEVTINSYAGAPQFFAIACAVAIKGVVTIATVGMPARSNLMPSSTLPELHDPQSPTPARTKSACCWSSVIASGATLWPDDFLCSRCVTET